MAEKCFLVHVYAEEPSMGSSPSVEVWAYTDEALMDAFIHKWHEEHNTMKRLPDDSYQSNGWIYWLEVEETIINFQPHPCQGDHNQR